MTRQPKIVLAYCMWDSIKPSAAMCLVSLATAREIISAYVMVEGTLLPFARNDAIKHVFKKDKDFTHVWFIDGDMTDLNPQMAARLVSHDVDIVTPVCVRRRPPYKPACCPITEYTTTPLINALDSDTPGLVECYHAGTAAMLIKREVLEALQEDTCEGPIWFATDRFPAAESFEKTQEWIKEKMVELPFMQDVTTDQFASTMVEAYERGINATEGSPLIGEDVYFCRKARAAGFKIYVDTGIHIGHIGDQVYTFKDYAEWHRGQNRDNQAAQVLLSTMPTTQVIPTGIAA